MKYVLITVHSGIIGNVTFFGYKQNAIKALKAFVKQMNIEKDDAGVYTLDGMIANVKEFIDEETNTD